MNALLDKLLAIARRELLNAVRYRSGFVLELSGVLAEITAFFFLARAVGPNFQPDGIAYFPFLLVGTTFYTFLMAGVGVFVGSVREAQLAGTMEVLMSTATSGETVLLLDALAAFIARSLYLLFGLVAGILLFGIKLTNPNVPAFVLIFALSVAVAVEVGILAAAVQIAIQKGQAVIWAAGTVAGVVTGTLFPISALPLWAQKLSWLVPVTHSLRGLRASLIGGASWAELSTAIGILAAWAVVLLPISTLVFTRVLRTARRRGTLCLY